MVRREFAPGAEDTSRESKARDTFKKLFWRMTRAQCFCLITKNEEASLPRVEVGAGCGKDEIVVAVTGSKDRTLDVAKSFKGGHLPVSVVR